MVGGGGAGGLGRGQSRAHGHSLPGRAVVGDVDRSRHIGRRRYRTWIFTARRPHLRLAKRLVFSLSAPSRPPLIHFLYFPFLRVAAVDVGGPFQGEKGVGREVGGKILLQADGAVVAREEAGGVA